MCKIMLYISEYDLISWDLLISSKVKDYQQLKIGPNLNLT